MGLTSPAHADEAAWRPLTPAEARGDNPLKGFMPFSSAVDHDAMTFPYTMEWTALPLNAVVTGEGRYDWSRLEAELDAIAGRGHQAALRFHLDSPGAATGVPSYLLGPGGIDQSRRYQLRPDGGITLTASSPSFSPDYEDPRVQELITDFVAAFGERYDADPRIGYITTGLVGFWGEQHTYPMNGSPDKKLGNSQGDNWMPSRETELRFFRAWDAAFDTTRLLNRYPGTGLGDVAVGFHDDSFSATTLPTVNWHFLALMNRNGLKDRWRQESIGGEIQPPIQGCVFDGAANCPGAEDFGEAVRASHVSWLINNHAYSAGYQGEALSNALAAHASLGYDLVASEARIQATPQGTTVSVKIMNRGVAPFPYDWPVEFTLLDAHGNPVATRAIDADLPGLSGGDRADETAELSATLPPGAGTVAVRIPNPMPGGAPLRFANAEQDAHADGYLSLGGV